MTADALILDGEFRLLRPAGSGGSARVYLAEEVASGARVAVKMLRHNLAADADMQGRFAREAAVLSRLEHPNIVRLLRFEQSAGGVLLLLEWVDGRGLDQVVAEWPMQTPRALRVLRQLASALAAIHAAGVVHRDLKPGNVMLEGEGDAERVRLLDFGIARFADPVLAQDQFQSALGHFTGTPAYISPEQASGRTADARSDVYTFGVLAYLVLTGHLPFVGKSDVDVLAQHLTKRPPRLSPADQSLEGSRLEALVMQCLEKQADDRPADGAALVKALEGDVTSPRAG